MHYKYKLKVQAITKIIKRHIQPIKKKKRKKIYHLLYYV